MTSDGWWLAVTSLGGVVVGGLLSLFTMRLGQKADAATADVAYERQFNQEKVARLRELLSPYVTLASSVRAASNGWGFIPAGYDGDTYYTVLLTPVETAWRRVYLVEPRLILESSVHSFIEKAEAVRKAYVAWSVNLDMRGQLTGPSWGNTMIATSTALADSCHALVSEAQQLISTLEPVPKANRIRQ
jgi:hypothetical protein